MKNMIAAVQLHILISKIKKKNQTFVLGFDGFGGSGKTTLANDYKRLIEKEGLRVTLLHLDDIIRKKQDRYNTSFPEWYEYYYLQWDVGYIRQQILEPLQKSGFLDSYIQFYDKNLDQHYEKKVVVPEKSVCMIEGVFLQREEWRPYFDFVYFVDCGKDKRLKRILKRDTYIGNVAEIVRKYEVRYFPAEEYYEKKRNPKSLANEVIVNT
ncbi:uridine kinase [Anoxybacillus vitaminiphilus]|uniref:Uridine kinase n=1 Tax=Paranoxybacillus vitaminiphilus TaxID=581036 RepID=A0A327YME7_9BACL|nr:uridine kinase [Anoxybacillus vitaminiphilus]RAK22080.1 uridine kinase [Anoxybacillus vitaminiphilus]